MKVKSLAFVGVSLALLFLTVPGAVGWQERAGLPAIERELPSDPVASSGCREARAVLVTVPHLNLAPVRTVKLAAGQKQLFLDNGVLARVEHVKRTLHQPRKYGAVIRPDEAWEGRAIQIRSGPSWNPEKKLWMIFYLGGGYATSRDGIHWKKPVLGLVIYKGSKENNLMLPRTTYTPGSFFDSSGRFNPKLFHILEGNGINVRAVFYDPQDPDPERRYKGFATSIPFGPLHPAVSADGRKWKVLETSSVPSSDEFHLFHDARRNLYVATVKQQGPYGRSVYLSVSKDFVHWTKPGGCLIFHADQRDQKLGAELVRRHLRNPDLRQPTINRPKEYKTDIYNLPVFAYQGLYIGMPTVFNHSGNTKNNSDGFSMVELAVSRDLMHWERGGTGKSLFLYRRWREERTTMLRNCWRPTNPSLRRPK
ncbi:MAG TPA: hypothetical protein VMW54_00695 [Terriglobia bacterium]|nr:hypothetical protein [Terriglobia bacterium]